MDRYHVPDLAEVGRYGVFLLTSVVMLFAIGVAFRMRVSLVTLAVGVSPSVFGVIAGLVLAWSHRRHSATNIISPTKQPAEIQSHHPRKKAA